LSKHEWELVDERCKELHEADFIQPLSSDFVAATVMPAKKDSIGLWIKKRMYRDYMLQPYFEEGVSMRLTFPEWGLGSPPGLLKL
jgi:hypothetical protein